MVDNHPEVFDKEITALLPEPDPPPPPPELANGPKGPTTTSSPAVKYKQPSST